MLKNFTLKTRLTGSFVILALLAGILMYSIPQLAFSTLANEAIPVMRVVGMIGELTRTAQAETLEFVSTGHEGSVEEFDEATDELVSLSRQLTTQLSQTPEETQQFELMAADIQQLSDLGKAIIRSHRQTLASLDDFELLEEELEELLESYLSQHQTSAYIEAFQAEKEDQEKIGDTSPSKQILTELIGQVRILQFETQEFVNSGNQDAQQEFDQAIIRLEWLQSRLVAELEASPATAGFSDNLKKTTTTIITNGQSIFATHRYTLALLENLEAEEDDLDKNTAAAQVLVTQQVNGSIANFTSNILIATLAIVILAAAIGFSTTKIITHSVDALVQGAEQIRAGDLITRIQTPSNDEFSLLAEAFNNMAAQLQRVLVGLEQRVAERTHALEVSMAVSRRLSTILEEKQLVSEVVEQVRAAFDYYYAQIYLFDERQEKLVIVSGTGEAGLAMLARGHSLNKGQGLVGQAAETNSMVLVTDVSQAAGWLSNPLLPDTKAEVAVPIAMGETVWGVLDVQHNKAGGLQLADADLIQAIAHQVAVALQNARAYARAQKQAEREVLVNTINSRIQSATTVEQALQIAVRELGRTLGRGRTQARLAIFQAVDDSKK